MVNLIVRVVFSLLVMLGCPSFALHGMNNVVNGAKKLVISYLNNAKKETIVTIDSHKTIEVDGKKENSTNIFKMLDPYWECPIISTRYLNESVVTILYSRINEVQNVLMMHYDNNDDSFNAQMLGLRNHINHLNSQVNNGIFFDRAQFIIIFPTNGPEEKFTPEHKSRCKKQSSELQALVRGALLHKNITVTQRPYSVPYLGLSPIAAIAVLSPDEPSFWAINALSCPVGNTGLVTELHDFVNDTKE